MARAVVHRPPTAIATCSIAMYLPRRSVCAHSATYVFEVWYVSTRERPTKMREATDAAMAEDAICSNAPPKMPIIESAMSRPGPTTSAADAANDPNHIPMNVLEACSPLDHAS